MSKKALYSNILKTTKVIKKSFLKAILTQKKYESDSFNEQRMKNDV